MNSRARHGKTPDTTGKLERTFRLAPITRALALALVAGASSAVVMEPVHAQAAGGAWFAAKGANQNVGAQRGNFAGSGPGSRHVNPAAEQQKANAQLQRSIGNLNLAARGIAAQQAAQAAARLAAAQSGAGVPDGLADGGLKVDTAALTQGWRNARGPVQSQQDGRTHVAIEQTADKAILNWETFNVGRNTTVDFKQQAGWAVLNRVNDPNARPSQIQGQIKGDGTVMVVNRNGVVFNGTSQVNVRNLVAAAANITDAQFDANGIYSVGTVASFTGAQGLIDVQVGARIVTAAPGTSTQGGGYVLLLGQGANNAGDIATPKGQALLAAGDSFLIRRGVASDANQASTTRGNEVTPQFAAESLAGKVSNSGLILAREGDITLTGRDVLQSGVIVATTSVNTRGTVHLNALNLPNTGIPGASDRATPTHLAASITLGENATTSILIEADTKSTALDSQRDALRGPAMASELAVIGVDDRRDQSRIEITSAGTVDFRSDSLTLATGGQIVVNAGQRTLVRERAQLDVSGAVGVTVAMESNNVKVNIQGNEQRDAPVNRDSTKLNSNDVWIDRRTLVFVPKGTNGYDSDRWYTAGGLLEVAGYLGTQGHTVGEWMAQGGTVRFAGSDVVTRAGSNINLSGGTLNVQTGQINQSWLRGADGRLYEISRAPGDLLYTGLYKGYEDKHARWGEEATGYYYNPLIAPRQRTENGYTAGRDAGKLVISTASAVLEGEILSETFQGEQQTQAPQAMLDGYNQSQKAVARRAQLIVGKMTPSFEKSTGILHDVLGADASTVKTVLLQQGAEQIAAGLDLTTALPADRQGSLILDTDRLSGFNLGAVKVAASQAVTVQNDLHVDHGGTIILFAPQIDVNANLTARSGTIRVGNVLEQIEPNGMLDTTLGEGRVTVGQGVMLDTRGLWVRQTANQYHDNSLAFLNGGTISLRSSADLTLTEGSVIDVSSGAAWFLDDTQQGGRGGNVAVQSNASSASGAGRLVLDADVRGHGVIGGGTMSVQSGRVLISDAPVDPASDALQLGGQFFNKGFAAYDVMGNLGVSVAEGTRVDIGMPVYRFSQAARFVANGVNPDEALEVWTPPVYREDAASGVLTQRRGASFTLRAGDIRSSSADMATVQAVIGKDAVITVDARQSINVRSIGQLTMNGQLNAWGGRITLAQAALAPSSSELPNAIGHGRSILVGEHAVLDVAARAATAVDAYGDRYGLVDAGGSIVIGGELDHALGSSNAAQLFVVIRAGAVLDASGTQAVLDIPGRGAVPIASHGGTLSIASRNGLYLDGTMRALAGGSGAAGGTLDIALESNAYPRATATERVLMLRELVLSQQRQGSAVPVDDDGQALADSLVYGHGKLAADQVREGGFGSFGLLVNGVVSFDGTVDLALAQRVSLYSGALVLAESAPADARVRLSAAHVQLAGLAPMGGDGNKTPTLREGASERETQGVFEVDAELLDIRNELRFGARGNMSRETDTILIDRRGFDQIKLHSAGDLRLLDATSGARFTRIDTSGLLDVMAAQLYPATHAEVVVSAGDITIGRVSALDPAVPYSVFGQLTLEADTINQGGVVRAPLGRLVIGRTGGGPQVPPATAEVNLLAGSLTSVSAQGLTMPYGGTVDGTTYLYEGRSLAESLLIHQEGAVPRGMELRGQSMAVAQGAVVDVSGGGELTGAGFVSGRGGSTDARFNPLVQYGADGTFTLPDLSTNPIYAIVPGAQQSVATADAAAGRQITIGAGVPGLPAGTYTLLPASYALLPGAFRVELNGQSAQGRVAPAHVMRNGSWSSSGSLSIAHTDVRDSLPTQVIVTPADVLRRYSQYNETSLTNFALADAARLGVPAILLPRDARAFDLRFDINTTGRPSFSFAGQLRNAAGDQGIGSTTAVIATSGDIEIVRQGNAATPGFTGITLADADLNAIGSRSLELGGSARSAYGQGGNYLSFVGPSGVFVGSRTTFRSGAALRAPEVLVIGTSLVEPGASISTLGQGRPARDGATGFIYAPGTNGLLAISNGRLTILAPEVGSNASIRVGVCETTCVGTASLYSEGSIAMATRGTLLLEEDVRYGTRQLTLAVGSINAGSVASLADAAAGKTLPNGLTLNQGVLDRLLRGDAASGAPALETLEFTVADAINFFGDVDLNTFDATTGRSRLKELVLTTPGIYGAGTRDNVATIRTASLIWNGAIGQPGAVATGGAGTGSGTLDIQAERIEFGYGPRTQPSMLPMHDRLALGFANVNLQASDRITANHKGSLAVYQHQGAYEDGKGYQYSGGNLNMTTPLLTGEAGSINRLVAGDAIRMVLPAGVAAGNTALTAGELGAELSLSGRSIALDTRISLPSGKLTLDAEQDLTLGDSAHIDMSGRTVVFNDVSKYSWGGDVTLYSRSGNIRQAAASIIDLRAVNNQAGKLRVAALDAAAGLVDLQGQILGSSSGYYDAGGTLVPYVSGSVDIRAQRLGEGGGLDAQFAGLNQRLNNGQIFGARSFQIKQGNLTLGSDVKASEVNISVDNGSLTVAGLIDASGERVGNIRLAGKNGLTLAGSALLDAHGSLLRVDSYGKIIDSPNRAIVELNSGNGTLVLASGARIDLRHGTAAVGGQHDARPRGTLELSAPRIGSDGRPTSADGSQGQDAATHGDLAIDAQNGLIIEGARSIALNAVQRYTDAPIGTDPAASGRPYQWIDQNYLNAKHRDSVLFIDRALANGTLLGSKLAGLNNTAYQQIFHLRPGVEVVATGDLVVRGDLDLSGHRYASLNPNHRQTAVYGSGEAGALVMRAGGDLDIYGSINDGFAPPPPTQDDNGWVLSEGQQMYGTDVVLPIGGVVLHPDTAFPSGTVLNYAVPIQAMTVAAGTVLPTTAGLAAPLTLAAGTILSGAIYDANGTLVHAAGTLLNEPLVVAVGMKLGAGTRLTGSTSLQAMIWPAGVALPSQPVNLLIGGNTNVVRLASSITLAMGSLIPSMTDLKLGGTPIDMRALGADQTQGRNWAIAQMLPEGSLSWSMRLVAGADLGAADTRLTDLQAEHGTIHLADTHFGMKAVPAAGGLVWTAEGALDMLGDASLAGTPIDFESINWPTMCDDIPSYCTAAAPAYLWTEAGALDMLGDASLAGTPIDFPSINWDTMCADIPEYCTADGNNLDYDPAKVNFSVLRTGTGDLELATAGNLNMHSMFGVYTAGSSTPVASAFNQPRGRIGTVTHDIVGGYEHLVDGGAESIYRAWYPDHGGNLLLDVGGNLTGDSVAASEPGPGSGVSPNAGVGNWLWRQGSGQALAQNVPTAWWINFGSYADVKGVGGLVGFTGFGTLGGGDVDVRVAGSAGTLVKKGDFVQTSSFGIGLRSQGLILAVGSTGRVGADGQMELTGGGDLNFQVGGGVNPTLAARNMLDENGNATSPVHDLQGALINLRGNLQVQAAALGGVDVRYGRDPGFHDATETRAYDPFTATVASSTGGLLVIPGDATVSLSTRGDLVLGGATDPGRVKQLNSTPFDATGTPDSGQGYGWFSLWTDRTAIDLFAAGGNLTPSTQLGELTNNDAYPRTDRNASPTDGRFVFPSILRAVAANGSVYSGPSALFSRNGSKNAPRYSLVLAPSPAGQLEFLAGNSIYGGGYAINQSGADSSTIATPLAPAFVGYNAEGTKIRDNQNGALLAGSAETGRFPLFAFGSDTAVTRAAATPARFYASNGDIVGLRTGEIMSITIRNVPNSATWYSASSPARIIAGRDIVSSGVPAAYGSPAQELIFTSGGNLFVHNDPTDVSIVQAGRDILYSTFNVAGPGTLEVTAGRHIQMEDRASITSLGAIVPGDSRAGATIAMQAGVGAYGADYARFTAAYLNPGNLAQAGTPLADQAGRVVKTYEVELRDWLAQRYGFEGDVEQARAFYAALPGEQQRVFARTVYFAELQAGGREYNDANGPRFGSYLRGRDAIAALFPQTDAAGDARSYLGNITMYGGSGVRTNFGGGIQMLTPGGQQVFGIEGAAPPSTAGVITQGAGDIQLYSQGSILLGQSRIMTTFGGSILGWSAGGDINAGRGSKTTVVFTPPKRVYDLWGNVTISPDVPSTGAGIATLAPIPEVPAGDIDLIAPLGTIDAGEAGIRVSGNVNLAALQVVNAANIAVQGDSTGVPVLAAVNVGALTNASAAASQASTAAQDTVQRARAEARQNLPSIITVRVLGFGNDTGASVEPETRAPSAALPSTGVRHVYDASHPVQLVGLGGSFDATQLASLTEQERRLLQQTH